MRGAPADGTAGARLGYVERPCVPPARRGGGAPRSLWLRASGGAIVNLCDVHTERPLPQFSVYSSAKAGVVALTRTLALELAPAVRVNAVSPGSLDWPEDGVFSDEERTTIENAIPLGRLGDGDDIASAVEFLLRGNRYITGHVLAVTGSQMFAYKVVQSAGKFKDEGSAWTAQEIADHWDAITKV